MENQNGAIYLWNGQEIVNFQPRNFVQQTITTRFPQKNMDVRIVYIKGKNRFEILINSHLELIFLLGGQVLWKGPTNDVECYNLRLKTWQYAPPMRYPHMGHSAVAASDDTIVVCGGCIGPRDISSCEIFSSSYQRYVPQFE